MLPNVLALALLTVTAPTQESTPTLLICGFDEVIAVGFEDGAPRIPLRLEVGALPGVPEELRARFGTTDECKVAATGEVLIASSGGAVGIYEVGTGQVSFAAQVHNAHSIELLPGGRVVSAASVGGGGDRLMVHERAGGELLQEVPLHSAHGVQFDPERERLYALGMAELLCLTVDAESGELGVESRFALPEGEQAGGHDLRAVPRSSELLLTTSEHVWLFDRDLERFRLHPLMGEMRDVKSVDVHPRTGRIAYVQADEGEWWSARVRLANPAGELELEGERFYKARWSDSSGALVAGSAIGSTPTEACTTRARAETAAEHTHLVFGSCADEDEGTARAWRRVGALAPDAIILLGDTPYIDSTDLEIQRRRHREFAAFAPFSELARSTPVHGTWDDHDFGRNDTDGRLEGKENARLAWIEARSVPPFGGSFGQESEGIFSSFRHGPVEVFLLDARWFARTEPSEFDAAQPSLLGAVQWDWLREGLRASDAPFKVLACGMIWNGAVRPLKTDHWGAYPAEFEGLCRFLGEHGVEGVLLVGGDIHRSRVIVHETTESVGYPLVELISSPMHDRIIELANAPHPGLRFDTGLGHVVLELAADGERLFATFHTPSAVLYRMELRADELRRPD